MTEPLVLVVDDNENDASMLSMLLRMFGYRSVVASSVDEGIELAKRKCPNLILCDIVMPGKDGFDLLHMVRNSELKCIPVWAVTAIDDETIKERISAEGFDDQVLKPLVSESFMSKLDALFKKSEGRKMLDTTLVEIVNTLWLLAYGTGFFIRTWVEANPSYQALYSLAPEWLWITMLLSIGVLGLASFKYQALRRKAVFLSSILWIVICSVIVQTLGLTLAFWVFLNMSVLMMYAFISRGV